MNNEGPDIILVGFTGRPTVSQGLKFWITVLFVAALLMAIWLVPEPQAAPCAPVTADSTGINQVKE